ncbi:type II secretion system protein J [Komagataeibacter diospyri]|uniref:General secretion pathway protein I n=1 Tax=Komagataeibacter diospyri TaxID=1932662 RepID=A0A4P5NYF6_9PROT|nr:prepilin-type N-terminal cleavage/methylation domain-containing protein [Komagataeibacter diospyri]GCE84981.1 general secretion pathway protein I [Komagataeibacter diospyri]GCE91854.1 general secretion pathway protein I [Komagataeibacter diospyri]
MTERAGHDAGFTLLEVMVAFFIAALALGVLFDTGMGGWRNAWIADRASEALSRAQSHLAVVGHGLAVSATVQEGDDGHGFRWRLRIVPVQSAGRLTLYSVEVAETWSRGENRTAPADEDNPRMVLLRTMRIGRAAGGGP